MIADILTGASNVAGAGLGIANFIRSIGQENYERQLQERIFQREDSAIQRRVEDLKKAGLNPILAAGAGASAGAVVGQSSRSVDPSPILQALNAQELQNRSLQNKLLKTEVDSNDITNTIKKGSLDYVVGKFLGNNPKALAFYYGMKGAVGLGKDILGFGLKSKMLGQGLKGVSNIVRATSGSNVLHELKNWTNLRK